MPLIRINIKFTAIIEWWKDGGKKWKDVKKGDTEQILQLAPIDKNREIIAEHENKWIGIKECK